MPHFGAPISFAFTGALRPSQEQAIAALLPHDNGVLAASTAFGKTVLAIRMIAERGLNALILVHRRQLMTNGSSGSQRSQTCRAM